MTSVAVAVASGRHGKGKGKGSKRAVKWAAENMIAQTDRFILVHVMPTITHIPTPSGKRVSIQELDASVVSKYVKDVKMRYEEIFIKYKKIIRTEGVKVETLVLENDNPATGLLKYISKADVRSLVLGSHHINILWRKIKGPGVSSTVLKCSPDYCDIFIVSKRRVITKLAVSLITNEDIYSGKSTPNLSPSPNRGAEMAIGTSPYSAAPSCSYSSGPEESSSINTHWKDVEISVENDSVSAQDTEQKSLYGTLVSNEEAELEKLKHELETTMSLYNRACKDLVHAQNQVQELSTDCVVEADRINAATKREETLRKNAMEEKVKKHLIAMKEAEKAKTVLIKEANERRVGKASASEESSEKMKVLDEMITNDIGYRRYNAQEIEVATDHFSVDKVIGEGSYGKVYKGTLDHTPVAIKALQHEAADKKDQFLKEFGILRNVRHPNVVLLLGACPENGCLVYEYMERGSLEEFIFNRDNVQALPWFARFRIAFEISRGLAFLHGTKPKPIVHRDLKPSNILLGRNHVAKISDVGLAKFFTETINHSIAQLGQSRLAGNLYYMDPEYQRTGVIRPQSDLYSLGIILLQLLTGRHPNGLLMVIENAFESGSLHYMLDTAIVDWPLPEAEEMAKLALDCCKLRCRDRPDLERRILPTLKKLADVAEASMKVEKSRCAFAPKHYFCPIQKEIMEDPHIAADGYSYERRAIEAWFLKHDTSPTTKNKFDHFELTPNKTLQSQIQDWRTRVASSNTHL